MAESRTEPHFDCIIVGAGPAGLTALEYLARFHRKAVVLGADGPRPRLLLIDRTYNLPGYPEGVSGRALLARLRTQAESMGGLVMSETATRVTGRDGEFCVELSDGSALRSRKVLLAMGVRDRHPDIPNLMTHIGRFVRYCPVCDGYEHTGKQLGIIGSGPVVARHALFLEAFSNKITIFLHGAQRESLGRYQSILADRGIEIYQSRIVKILECPEEKVLTATEVPREELDTPYVGCGVCLEDGTEVPLGVLYSALGCDLHLDPVRELALDLDEDGYVKMDNNQQTRVPGVYAAGDMVSQINQISVAFGQATVAAVHIHNALEEDI